MHAACRTLINSALLIAAAATAVDRLWKAVFVQLGSRPSRGQNQKWSPISIESCFLPRARGPPHADLKISHTAFVRNQLNF